jgi:hypothetical protein
MHHIISILVGLVMSFVLMVLSHIILGKFAILGLIALLVFCGVAWTKAD